MEFMGEYFEPVLDGKESCYVFRCVKPISSSAINSILGAEPVRADGKPSWYTQKERNLELLDKALNRVHYPYGKTALAALKAVYLKQMGCVEEAAKEIEKVGKVYPESDIPNRIRQYVASEQ